MVTYEFVGVDRKGRTEKVRAEGTNYNQAAQKAKKVLVKITSSRNVAAIIAKSGI